MLPYTLYIFLNYGWGGGFKFDILILIVIFLMISFIMLTFILFFYRVCVNIVVPPKEEENWFCVRCISKRQTPAVKRRRRKHKKDK